MVMYYFPSTPNHHNFIFIVDDTIFIWMLFVSNYLYLLIPHYQLLSPVIVMLWYVIDMLQ